jgi:hypothetical protein
MKVRKEEKMNERKEEIKKDERKYTIMAQLAVLVVAYSSAQPYKSLMVSNDKCTSDKNLNEKP